MVGATVLASSALYISYRAYNYVEQEKSPAWWQKLVSHWRALGQPFTATNQAPKESTPSATIQLPTRILFLLKQANSQAETPKQRLLLSVATLGIVTASAAYYPPARLAALPVLLYLGVKPAWQVKAALQGNGPSTADLVEITVIVLAVAQGYYLIGLFGCSLYYLGQMIIDRQSGQIEQVAQWQPPTWAWRQSEQGEEATEVKDLRVGDTVVVHAGEMVPIAGIISNGTAWVQSARQAQLRLANPQGIGEKVTVGDRIEATTIVMVGTITISVLATA